ncbi:MAG: alpha/beta fold hydrolase [Bacteroidia bacterium]|nr:alpha/beta fold hydrolase [Bacteroidia bacterium]
MILLLHGALGSEAQFGPIKALFPPDQPAHSFSFDGHGGIPAREPYAIGLFVRNTLRQLDLLEIESCNLFGYSMGGYVALQLALQHPDRVRRIVTLGTKFHWTPESAAAETRKLDPDAILAKVPRFAAMLEQRHAPLDWRQVLHSTAALMHGLGHGQALRTEDLARIPHPVRILIGELDTMVTLAESQAAAAALPQGSLETIPGLAHPIEQAAPEQLKAVVLAACA